MFLSRSSSRLQAGQHAEIDGNNVDTAPLAMAASHIKSFVCRTMYYATRVGEDKVMELCRKGTAQRAMRRLFGWRIAASWRGGWVSAGRPLERHVNTVGSCLGISKCRKQFA